MKTKFTEYLNESKNYEVIFDGENKGKLITPYVFKNAWHREGIQIIVNFNELYEGMFSFAKYSIVDFNIKSDSVENAIEMAKNRLDDIFSDGCPNSNKDIFEVTGTKYDYNNNKVPYELKFMENTHLRNPFTKSSYVTKKGDLLKHDVDGDGWGFWYAVDKSGKRISDRLKGTIFVSSFSNGIIKKYE